MVYDALNSSLSPTRPWPHPAQATNTAGLTTETVGPCLQPQPRSLAPSITVHALPPLGRCILRLSPHAIPVRATSPSQPPQVFSPAAAAAAVTKPHSQP